MVAKDDVTERILRFTLEIIYLLTGEDYGPLKKLAEAAIHYANPSLSGGQSKSQSSTVVPPLIQERSNEQKILELANKIIQLLTGEVPIRCQDVTVYFSMEEWEYLEEHEDLYKDVMMDDHQSFTSPIKFVLSGCSPTYLKEEYVTKDGVHVADNFIFTATSNSRQHPSPHIKQGMLLEGGGGHLQDTDMLTATEHTNDVSFHIKEETALGFEENPSDCSKPSSHNEPYTAHHFKRKPISYHGGDLTDTDTSSATDHTQQCSPTHIKEGPVSYDGEDLTHFYTHTDHSQQYPVYIKEGPPSQQRGKLTTIYTQHPSFYMKQELISCDEGDLTDTDINMTSGHTQLDPSSPIKEGEASCDRGNHVNTNVYTPSEHVQYTSGHTKDQRKNRLEYWCKTDLFSCPECDKSFNCKSELLMHLPVHSGDKPYNCSICGKCFTNLSYLITHGKIHAGEKRYSCPDCGVSFTRSSNLKAHKRKHTGEKPYLCSDCGKSFSSNSNLNAHRKRHAGDKPYCCPDCGKSFISRSHLVVHQRTHTGEKPYTCPLCIKCFSNTSDLAKHRKIHNKKPYYCSKCGKCYKSNPDFDNQKLHVCNS